jgi:hypothetical protein
LLPFPLRGSQGLVFVREFLDVGFHRLLHCDAYCRCYIEIDHGSYFRKVSIGQSRIAGRTSAEADLQLTLDQRQLDSLNGLRKSLQAIDAGNEDILNASIFQLRDHLQPELRAFRLGNPQAKHFLLSGQVESNRQIDGLDAYAAIPDFDVDAVGYPLLVLDKCNR